MLVLASSSHNVWAQKSIDSIYEEIDQLKKDEPSIAVIDRLIQLAGVLEDSAAYSELTNIYKLALNRSRQIDHLDSEHLAFIKLANEYFLMGAYQTAATYSDSLLNLEGVNDSLRKTACYIKGTALSVIGEYSTAINELEKALAISFDLPDELEIYDFLSFSYLSIGSYDKAIETCLSALDLLKSTQPDAYHHFSQFYHNLGLIYLKNQEYQKAIDYYKSALSYNYKYQEKGKPGESIDNVVGFAKSKRVPLFLELGQLFRYTGAPDSSLFYYLEAKELDKFLPPRNKEIRQASIAIALADIYNDLGQYRLAYNELVPVEAYFVAKLKEYTEHVNYLISKGTTLQGLGDYSASLETLLEAKRKSEELNIEDEKTITILYESLVSVHEAIGNHKKALDYFRAIQVHKDSIYNSDKARIIKELQEKYLSAEKEKKIAEFERNQSRLKSQLTNTLLASGFLLLFSISLFRFYKVKQRANKLLAKQKVDIAEKATDLESKNHMLEELSNYKQGLTHMIAHDMKNRLNVVLGMSEGTPDKKRMREINHAGKMILQMVTNMLDVQKFEESRMHLNLRPCALSDLVDQAAHQLELLLVTKSIQFENRVSDDIVVEIDEDLIIRVFDNLFSNAVKYSDIGGRLLVSFEPDGDRARISVQDEGRGIHREELPYIFDKFWQTESRLADRVPSTGLGLTFCKMAIEAHGGLIQVFSELGQGASFVFDLKLIEVGAAGNETQKEVLNPEIDLKPRQKDILQPYIQKIRSYPPNKAGKIHMVLSKIESEDPVILAWKQRVKRAVFQYDQKALEELLS